MLPTAWRALGRKERGKKVLVWRSFRAYPSGVRNVPVACVDCVNGSPCRIGTVC